MKKTIALLVSALLCLSLFAACSNDTTTTDASDAAAVSDLSGAADASDAAASATPETYKIAIVQQLDHASLDEIRTAIEAKLTAASDENVTYTFDAFSGQNDASVLNQIGAQVVGGDYDAIIPIATLAAQCMVTAADGTDIPIVYAAISDPSEAGLLDIANVTGTSDALDTALIMDMMFTADPTIETVGLLYSNSEPNSTTPIADAKAYLDEKGIRYVEKTGNTTDEILAAATALSTQADAVFTPTDNVVMGAAGAVAEILNEAGIPHYAGADSFVSAGAFATCGINYTDLGTYSAQMTIDILAGGAVPAYHVMEGGIITVNTETAATLGLDYSGFAAMAKQVKEVTTAE